MFPLDCEGIGEHCSESCHTEFGRIRAVGFIDPCYDLDINSQESWDNGVAGGYITIVPQTNGELTIDQLQGDGYGKRPQTNTIKEYTLTYNDPTFIGNYNFYDGASGQYKYKIFFRTSDAIYFSDTAVLITPNFSIQNDLGQRIDWTVTLTWRSKFFPIINTALNSEYLFACTACTPQICFFIQSVTGNLVDNTDPCNPVVDAAVSSDAGNGLTLGSDGLPYFSTSSSGTTWLNGTGVPAAVLGAVGNYYIDTATGDVYLKTGILTWTLISDMSGKVPYTGAIQDVDLGVYKLTADAVEFSLTPTNAPAAGQIAYEGNTGALAYLMNSSTVKSSIGQTLHAYVHNADSVTILKGQPVYIFGASGNKASVKLAANTSDATSAKTLGLAAEDITSGQKGFVTCQGVLDGLNTGMYSAGDILYVGATAGSLTTTKPYAPNHLVYIGVVERANAGNGQIYVRAQNGYELDEIHDVDLISVSPVNNDVLTYVTGSPNLWKPRSVTSILGGTPPRIILADTGTYTLTGTNSQTIMKEVLIPANTFTGGIIVVDYLVTRISGTGNNILSYINIGATSGTIGTQIVRNANMSTTTMWLRPNRTIAYKSATSTLSFNSTTAQATEFGAAAVATTSTNIDWTINQYLQLTLTNQATGDTSSIQWITITHYP